MEKLEASKGLIPLLSDDDRDYLVGILAAFCKTLPTQRLVAEAQAIRNGWAPVQTPKQIHENEHLRARGYWTPVHHPELDAWFDYPGPWAKLSATPLSVRNRAPRIGEHNDEVYLGELSMDAERYAELSAQGVI